MKNAEVLDKSLYCDFGFSEPDIVWHTVRNAPFAVSGLLYDEELGCYTRMPNSIAEQVSPAVAHHNFHTSGGRVRFRTNSRFIDVRVVLNHNQPSTFMGDCGRFGFDMYRRKAEGSGMEFVQPFYPQGDSEEGYTGYPYMSDGEMADYVINFPLYSGVSELYIGLKANADILPPTPYRNPLPVVYYGSSITQGGCATRPGLHYPALLSRKLDTEFICLGWSGCGKGEPVMADYIAGLQTSLFVCDYDHNAPDAEHLQKTHMPMYRKFREKQPDAPILFMTSPVCYRAADIYTYIVRREIIRNTYSTALREGDRNVYFIDGFEFFPKETWGDCTVDRSHPNDLGFSLMAQRIEKEIRHLFR
ncbi:MAG: hypothetical protein IJ325_03940 [Clostridia bacterium]|nr:hypothetical protein [Clostridia bacterium]